MLTVLVEQYLKDYQYCYPVFLWSYKPFGKICKVLPAIFVSLSVKSFLIHFVASFVHCYTRLLLFLTLNVELNFCIDNSLCHLPARNFFCGQIKPGKKNKHHTQGSVQKCKECFIFKLKTIWLSFKFKDHPNSSRKENDLLHLGILRVQSVLISLGVNPLNLIGLCTNRHMLYYSLN